MAAETAARKCTLKGSFKGRMQALLYKGAYRPKDVLMSDWRYMKDHARNCSYCTEEFKILAKEARKGGNIDGPTTLRD
jgi:hypothetical protein